MFSDDVNITETVERVASEVVSCDAVSKITDNPFHKYLIKHFIENFIYLEFISESNVYSITISNIKCETFSDVLVVHISQGEVLLKLTDGRELKISMSDGIDWLQEVAIEYAKILVQSEELREDIDYIGDAPEVFEYINNIIDSLVKDSVAFINAYQEISKIVDSEEDVDNIQQLLSIVLNNKFVKFKIKDINSFYSSKYIISILEYEDGERGYSILFNSDMDALVNNFKQ